jgi:hypothetical protein
VANLDAAARFIAGELRAADVTVSEKELQVGGRAYPAMVSQRRRDRRPLSSLAILRYDGKEFSYWARINRCSRC